MRAHVEVVEDEGYTTELLLTLPNYVLLEAEQRAKQRGETAAWYLRNFLAERLSPDIAAPAAQRLA